MSQMSYNIQDDETNDLMVSSEFGRSNDSAFKVELFDSERDLRLQSQSDYQRNPSVNSQPEAFEGRPQAHSMDNFEERQPSL